MITRDVIWVLSGETLSDRRVLLITRVWITVIGVFLVVFGLFYSLPASALKYIFITGNMYTAGAVSAVGFGLYWKHANDIGAYAALLTGAFAPLAFLLLANVQSSLPGPVAWIADANVSGFLSFGLGAAGMVAGSLLTRRIMPPKQLVFTDREDI